MILTRNLAVLSYYTESRDFVDSSLDVYADMSILSHNFDISDMMVSSHHTFSYTVSQNYTLGVKDGT